MKSYFILRLRRVYNQTFIDSYRYHNIHVVWNYFITIGNNYKYTNKNNFIRNCRHVSHEFIWNMKDISIMVKPTVRILQGVRLNFFKKNSNGYIWGDENS